MLGKYVSFGMVLLLVGCSGGGDHSTPASSTTVPPAHVTADLAPCPPRPSAEPTTALNSGVRGLNVRLVPIVATKVRVCVWDGAVAATHGRLQDRVTRLANDASLSPAATRLLEHMANHLTPTPPTAIPSCPVLGPGRTFHFARLTFANEAQEVTLVEDDTCLDTVGNGRRGAYATIAWVSALRNS